MRNLRSRQAKCAARLPFTDTLDTVIASDRSSVNSCQLGKCDRGDRHRSRQSIYRDLVLQIQFVARYPIAEIAVLRQVWVDHRLFSAVRSVPCRRLLGRGFHAAVSSTPRSGFLPVFSRTTFHGLIGLPCQRVDGGTSSPRTTSDAGPTVTPAPSRAAGSATPCGPRVAPGFQHDGVHPQDPVVEQMCLHYAATVDGAAPAQHDEVSLWQPIGFTPRAAADGGPQRA